MTTTAEASARREGEPAANGEATHGGVSDSARGVCGYHLFERRGRYFAYDLAHNQFLEVPALCFDVLRYLEVGIDAARVVECLAGRHGDGAVRHVLDEIESMRSQGYLRQEYQSRVRADAPTIDRLAEKDTGSIEINLAQTCNLACRYCYLAKNDALGGRLMDESTGRAAVDLVFARARRSDSPAVAITFFGGEPLLNKPLLKGLVDYAIEKGVRENRKVRFSMTTNGTLLDEEIIALVKRHNFGLMISMDGDRTTQDRMRPYAADGRGTFDDIARNVEKLRRVRRQLTARVTVSASTGDKLAIVEELERLGFTRIGMAVARGTVSGLGPWDLPRERYEALDRQDELLQERFLERLARGERPAYNPCSEALKLILRPPEFLIRCGVGRGMTTVTEEGKLYPCHRYVGMERYVIGDVRSGIDRTRLRAYLEQYFQTKAKCSLCWAQRLCGGACPWYASRPDGTMRAPDRWYCDRIRRHFEDAAALLVRVREEFPDYHAQLQEECLDSCGEP